LAKTTTVLSGWGSTLSSFKNTVGAPAGQRPRRRGGASSCLTGSSQVPWHGNRSRARSTVGLATI